MDDGNRVTVAASPAGLRPAGFRWISRDHVNMLQLAGVVAFAGLTALAAQARVPMWPVPMTLQTLSILLMAITLGPRLGTISAALYVAVGVCGAPVFSGGGGGWATMTGATGGYIIGFLLMPWVFWAVAAGSVRGSSRPMREIPLRRIALAIVASQATAFVFGVPWLALYLKLSPAALGGADPTWSYALVTALMTGLVVFLPGFVAKSLFALASSRATDLAASLRW